MPITGKEPALPFNYLDNTPGFKGVAVGLTILQQFAKDADVNDYDKGLNSNQLCELTGIPHPQVDSFSVIQRYRMECLAKLKVMKAKALIKALNQYGND